MEGRDQTLLHSAAMSNDVEAVKRLLKEGVDMHSKDKKGLTALHVLVQQRGDMLGVVQDTSEGRQITGNNQLAKNEKIINLLLENDTTGYDCPDFLGLTNFHVACTLQDSSIAECLSDRVVDIDQCINQDSPIYAGYTPLRLACLCNINTAKMLVAKGANLLIPDVKGFTSLEACVELYSRKELKSFLKSAPAWKNAVFSDGETKLRDYILSLRYPRHHNKFLQNTGDFTKLSLPNDSPVWPGCTILHIAVFLVPETHIDIVRDILATSSDIIPVQDIHGSTALHLAFRRDKMKFVKLFRQVRRLKHIKDAVDDDGLSHLHVAAAAGDRAIVEKLLGMKANVNAAYGGEPLRMVKSGWTPLHVAVGATRLGTATELLRRGADVMRTDSRGFTAIHMLLGRCYTQTDHLFAPDCLKECVVENLGLSHLHVAAWVGDCTAIERLLDMGSDIEATVVGRPEDAELRKFAGCRPIHMAMMSRAKVTDFAVLLRRGADIFTEKFDRPSPLRELLTGKYDEHYLASVVESIWGSEQSQRRMRKEMGMTMLHLACYALDGKRVKKLLSKGVDVDARIRDDSIVWPGFTPMHALILAGLRVAQCQSFARRVVLEKVSSLMHLLLKMKADVTVSNAEGDTPVHMALRTTNNNIGIHRAALLMEHQRDFSVNPVNEAGMSHFHVACLMKDARAAEIFLQSSHVDVNGAIDSTNDGRYAGQTPLMMALSYRIKKDYDAKSQVRLVDLLLERGAEVHAVDAFGYTTLHKLVGCSSQTRERLLDKILIDDRDVNKRANDGKTPIEVLLLAGASSDEIKYFVDRGSQINSYNPFNDVGYMAIVLSSSKCNKSKETATILKMMMDLPNIADADGTGRNAIHNAVSSKGTEFMLENDYIELFEKLKKLGCDIHQKDNLGRTALHLALKFENEKAVSALLICGVDINDTDAKGMSTPFYALQNFNIESWRNHWELLSSLYNFLKKFRILGLELSHENTSLSDLLFEKCKFQFDVATFEHQVKETNNMKIGHRGLTLYDFLYNTTYLTTYSSLLPEERNALNFLMKSFNQNKFNEVWHLVKMQCNKALDRVNLVATAASSLEILLGFPVPYLCQKVVLKALANSDLRNLNKAAIENDDVEMIAV